MVTFRVEMNTVSIDQGQTTGDLILRAWLEQISFLIAYGWGLNIDHFII